MLTINWQKAFIFKFVFNFFLFFFCKTWIIIKVNIFDYKYHCKWFVVSTIYSVSIESKKMCQIHTGLNRKTIGSVCEFVKRGKRTHFHPINGAWLQWSVAVAAQLVLAVLNANGEIFDRTILEWIIWLDGLVWWPDTVRLHIAPTRHFQARCILCIILGYDDCVHVYLQ